MIQSNTNTKIAEEARELQKKTQSCNKSSAAKLESREQEYLSELKRLKNLLRDEIQRHKKKEKTLQASKKRAQHQLNAMVELTTNKAISSDGLKNAFRIITEAGSRALSVERVGVWLFSKDGKRLVCADLFESSSQRHSEGSTLYSDNYPRYFRALQTERAINASNVYSDTRTNEFSEVYLKPLGITSLLDAPIRISGELVGGVCHEHTGRFRKWEPDEIAFAGQIADQAAQALIHAERKHALKSLKESEDKYRTFVENFQGIAFRSRKNFHPHFFHGAVKKISGYEAKEFISGKIKWNQIIHPEDVSKLMEQSKTQLKNPNALLKNEYRIIRKDGQIRWVYEVIQNVCDNKGRFMYLQGSIQDITEQKNAEEELKNSEERLKILFEFAPDAYYLHDIKGIVLDANKAAEELIGYTKDELIGKNILQSDILSKREISKAAALLAKNALGQATGPEEHVLCRKDRSRVSVEIRTFPVKIKNKTMILGIARDITERKQAENQTKDSLREKEILLQEIHHRVKNNMQIISSLLNLQSRHVENVKDLELFKSSQNQVKSMAIIHERLYQSKDFTKIDFADYVRSLTKHLFITYGIDHEAIKLKIDIKDMFLDINTAIPCGLMINELVSNSLKHAFPGDKYGEIKISMRPLNKDEIELIVSDNGIGIPENVDFNNTKSLGLYLFNILAEGQLHGKVRLDRINGTKFQIRLKVKQ